MLEIEQFKMYLEEHVGEVVTNEEILKNFEPRFTTQIVRKNNQDLTGMCLVPRPGREASITPTMYLEEMYKDYLRDENYERVLKDVGKRLNKPAGFLPSEITDKINLDNVFFRVVNAKSNAERLKNVPHREIFDLAMECRILIDSKDDGYSTIGVDDKVLNHLGVTKEELLDRAYDNTREMFPATVKGLSGVLFGLMPEMGVPVVPDDQEQLFVISNEKGVNGAASMLYDDVLSEAAERLDSDLYVLPSSVHEVLCCRKTHFTPQELSDMVNEINTGCVDISDRLSTNVYEYDREKHLIRQASNSEYAIDGTRESDKMKENAEVNLNAIRKPKTK